MRVYYDDCASADEVIACIAGRAPRTVILDVEPLVAHWKTSTATLNEGISSTISWIAGISSVRVIAFATNSNRRPTAIRAPSGVEILYRAVAMKPLRPGLFRDLPRPGVLVGDQIATDGVLACRLGLTFIRYRGESTALPLGPRIMNLLGYPLRPLLFRG